MPMLEDTRVECPYCGETFDTQVDTWAGSQEYIEDCPVCCRPIEFQLVVGVPGELTDLRARREDE